MHNSVDGILGLTGCLLTSVSTTVTEWVGIICSAAIALVTCGIQLYRLWRDRDTDIKAKARETKILSEEEKLSNIQT